MKLSLVERETILLYNQAEPMAEVYTHDPRLMEKLELLAKKHPDQITRKDAHNFTVPKRCVSVREPYSAERRKAASERAKSPDTSLLCESPAVKGTWQRMYLKQSSSRSAPEMRQRFMGSRSNEMAWPAVPFTMIRTQA